MDTNIITIATAHEGLAATRRFCVDLPAAVAAARTNAPEGVEYKLDISHIDDGDGDGDGEVRMVVDLTASFPEELEYTDEHWAPLADFIEGADSVLTNDDHGTVYDSISWEVIANGEAV